MWKRLKVMRSYTESARFWSEVGETVGYVPRKKDIPSPYSSSPVDMVVDWFGKPVIYREVAHRRFEIYLVPPYTHIYINEEDAIKAAIERDVTAAKIKAERRAESHLK